MIYEFLVGKRLSDFYIKQEYSYRWASDIQLSSMIEVLTILDRELHNAVRDMPNLDNEVSLILSDLAHYVSIVKQSYPMPGASNFSEAPPTAPQQPQELDLPNDPRNQPSMPTPNMPNQGAASGPQDLPHTPPVEAPSTDSIAIKIRETLSLLSYYNVEVYLLERPDLQSTEPPINITRAYLLDDYDRVFPSLNRVGTGYCMNFPAAENMSLPDMIFSMIGRTVRFSKSTTDILKLNQLQDKYDKLVGVGSAWTLNVSDILRFLNDYGFTIIGVIE